MAGSGSAPRVLTAHSESDLDQLGADIKAGRLPHTEGRFFGAADHSETQDGHAFVTKARDLIDADASAFYTSWWW